MEQSAHTHPGPVDKPGRSDEPSVRARLFAACMDAALIAAFVAIGRRNHAGELADGGDGFATAVWPFVLAAACGWLATRAWRYPLSPARAGVGIWATSVGGGMVLRALSDQGTAAAFVIVATVTLALLLVGWRLAATFVLRRRAISHATP